MTINMKINSHYPLNDLKHYRNLLVRPRENKKSSENSAKKSSTKITNKMKKLDLVII